MLLGTGNLPSRLRSCKDELAWRSFLEGPRQEFVSHIYSQSQEWYVFIIYFFSFHFQRFFSLRFWVPNNHLTQEMEMWILKPLKKGTLQNLAILAGMPGDFWCRSTAALSFWTLTWWLCCGHLDLERVVIFPPNNKVQQLFPKSSRKPPGETVCTAICFHLPKMVVLFLCWNLKHVLLLKEVYGVPEDVWDLWNPPPIMSPPVSKRLVCQKSFHRKIGHLKILCSSAGAVGHPSAGHGSCCQKSPPTIRA